MGLLGSLIPRNGIRSALARTTICTVTVVVVTAALFAAPIRDRATTAALIFLFFVLSISVSWGFRYAVFVSLLAALGFSWLLARTGVLWPDDPHDLLTVVLFLVIGIITSHLLDRVRKQALLAKQREQALRRSEAYLAEGQRLTNTGSWAWSPDNRKSTYWSEGMFRIFGLDPQKGIPERETFWNTCIHAEDREELYAHIHQAIGRKVDYLVEHRAVRSDGSVRYLQTIGHPVLNSAGEVIEVIGTGVDVTDRKSAEKALRASEERWKVVFENNPTMYFMVDVRGVIVSVNPFGAEQLGFKIDELIGRPVSSLFHVDDQETVERNTAICFRRRGQTVSWEARKLRNNGELLWVREVAKAILIENEPVALIVCEDITERKRVTEALREVEMELQHANRVATMGELTASIAHEVKQPIGGIVTNAQAALRFLDAQPVDLNEMREILNDIVTDGNRAAGVVDRIRALTRKAPLRKEPLEINGAVGEVIELTRGEAVKNGVLVEAELTHGLPLIQADRVQLQQVILNLIINAVQAMSTVRAGARRLLISTGKAEADRVLVAVQDSGPGLAPANLEHVFDAFYTTKPNGMGLGLSICRSIVEAHNGRLWASANTGPGATFQFTLPTSATAASPVAG
jgi:PAS domain S-box-containing protein